MLFDNNLEVFTVYQINSLGILLSLDVVRAVIKGNGTNKTTKDLTRRQKDGQSEMMVYENTCIEQRD